MSDEAAENISFVRCIDNKDPSNNYKNEIVIFFNENLRIRRILSHDRFTDIQRIQNLKALRALRERWLKMFSCTFLGPR